MTIEAGSTKERFSKKICFPYPRNYSDDHSHCKQLPQKKTDAEIKTRTGMELHRYIKPNVERGITNGTPLLALCSKYGDGLK
jgi:hypothetical protein